MKERFQNWKLSYAQKILLVTSLIILLMALLLGFSSWQLSSSLFSQLERELLTRNVENIYDQLNTSLDIIQTLTTQVVRSDALDEIIDSDEPSSQLPDALTQQLSDTLNTVISSSSASTTSSLQFVNVYLKNGYSCCSLSSEYLPFQNFDDCIQLMYSCGITDLSGYIPTCWFDDLSIQILTLSTRCLVGMRFLYEAVTLEKIGVIVVGIKQSNLQTLFSSLPSDCFIVRNDGVILAATQSKHIGQIMPYADSLIAHATSTSTSPIAKLPDDSEAFIYRLAGSTSWLVCPIDEYMLAHSSAVSQYTRQVIYITVVALVVSIFLSWLSSKGLTKSLVRLKGVVQKVYDGDLSARFQTEQNDEIAYLGIKINDMLEQVEDFFHTQERDAAEKRNLELQLMQAQINPHLLYNTLNSALWIIRQKDMEKAENLILSLGNFFKLALSKGNEEITLSNEIAMIQYYLKLQNLGRGKSFILRDEVPEDWRTCKVLRLTLQPLVENAVIHGFSDWRDDGEITISAQADETESKLQICVYDNGIGILPEDLENLLSDLHAYPPAKEHKHYGLYNVERRIKNKYGQQYGMSIESEVGDFTKITLTLPLNKENQHD